MRYRDKSRYSDNIVRIGDSCGPSGRVLRDRLEEEGFRGHINWGWVNPLGVDCEVGINSFDAIRLASNKKKALFTMRDAGVPVPPLYSWGDSMDFPVIGRTSYHTRGSGFFFCEDDDELYAARKSGATHFVKYIPNTREFRVHVISDGSTFNSIKISDKNKAFDPCKMDFDEGSWCYPHNFKRKRSLREVAKDAVESLGLDFGAVDIIYQKDEKQFYVLEVNTAPNLTESINNDTLERYVEAFMKLSRSAAQAVKEDEHEFDDLRYEESLRYPFRGRGSFGQIGVQARLRDDDLPMREALSPFSQESYTEAGRREISREVPQLWVDYQARERIQALKQMQYKAEVRRRQENTFPFFF